MRARIMILGAGQLGSRHLQALQTVRGPLEIHVVDPSARALERARERFDAAYAGMPHQVRFSRDLSPAGPTDVVIVATNADTRRAAVDQLLQTCDVRFLVLEKLVVGRPGDAAALASRLAGGPETWVNCPMRMMPPYDRVLGEIGRGPVDYRVSGSQYGLVTNAIHYVDHVAHLSGCSQFQLDVRGVDPQPVPSKREGFVELNGRLVACFADGSRCDVVCYGDGSAPPIVEIFTPARRYIVRESEGRLWTAAASGEWRWDERDARIPYQSEMTATLVETLLETGTCPLTPLSESLELHAALLDPLLELMRRRQPDLDAYPFT